MIKTNRLENCGSNKKELKVATSKIICKFAPVLRYTQST